MIKTGRVTKKYFREEEGKGHKKKSWLEKENAKTKMAWVEEIFLKKYREKNN